MSDFGKCRSFRPSRIFLAILAGVVTAAAGCRSQEEIPVAPEALLNMEADQMVIGLESHLRQEGIRRALLSADTAYFWEESDSVALRNINLLSYNETGGMRATVTAERGTLYPGDRMVARQNVVLIIPEEDRRIESAELHYDPERDLIESDSATVMYHGDQTISGSSFESDLDFRNVTVHDARTRGGGVPF